MTREQIIQRMQQAHRRVLQEVWEHRMPDLPVKTPEQLVTLASIVEKETGRPDERTRVAAVFVNRLKTKMRLAVGSDDHLRSDRRQGLARPADPEERDRAADALQYVRRSTVCRRDRSPIRDAPRSKRPQIRRAPRSSISLPTAPAATCSRTITPSTRRTSRGCAA